MAADATGGRFDPAPSFKFYVELEGIIVGEFTECSGLTMQRKFEEYREGGVNDYVHKLPGRTEYSNITLKRGITYSQALWDWYLEGLYDGKVRRINLSIILGNSEGKKVKQWDVLDAYPVKWTGPRLNTGSRDVAIEEIEIVHHGLSLSTEVGTSMGLV